MNSHNTALQSLPFHDPQTSDLLDCDVIFFVKNLQANRTTIF